MTTLETEWENVLWFSQSSKDGEYPFQDLESADNEFPIQFLDDPTFPSWVFGVQDIEDRPQASFTQILVRVA